MSRLNALLCNAVFREMNVLWFHNEGGLKCILQGLFLKCFSLS
jgi:hypothetical protein